MILIIRVFQVLLLFFVAYSIFNCGSSKKDLWLRLTIAKWVFYACGVMAFMFSFGIVAIIEEKDRSQISICVLFFIACIICVCIMFIQKMWYVKYNDEILIFRNVFGFKKKYNIEELTIINGQRVSRILLNGKTIIKWDTIIINIKEDIEISRFFNKKPKNKQKTS